MTLEDLRKKVIFQNSIDVWIASCQEKGIPWNNISEYKRFIAFLRDNHLDLKAFTLCAHEAGAVEKEKIDFAESLRELNEKDAATYTIKLNDRAVQLIRQFHN